MTTLPPPIEQYINGKNPTHTSQRRLGQHITFATPEVINGALTSNGLLSADGKITKQALEENIVDVCDKRALWNIREVKKIVLHATRKESDPDRKAGVVQPRSAQKAATGPVFTDLENIGTYFGVGKNTVGKWLEELGLRGYKIRQVNESGDFDMLDIAAESKEKFRMKVPTEAAFERGYAQVDVIEYTQKGSKKSFEKYSWNLEKVKNLLVKNGHELDTERKLLLKGKGKNSDVKVESLDSRAEALYREWKKLYKNPSTKKSSWKVFHKQPKPLLQRVEVLMGRPRYLQDKLYEKKF